MKAELKAFLARRIFLYKNLQEDFAIIAGLEPMSESTKERLQRVILELREEWIKV